MLSSGNESASIAHRASLQPSPDSVSTPDNAPTLIPGSGDNERRPRQHRRGAAREDLKAEILRAVRRLHAENGYGAVTMRSVAQAVGMPPMSLYRYFPNKSVLMECVWAEVLEASLQVARAASTASDSAPTRLRKLYEAYVNFWLQRPEDFKLVFDTYGRASPSFLAVSPASGFRQECEALIDACLPPGLDGDRRQQAYDLCRLKILGVLFASISLVAKPLTPSPQLLQAVLDDIEQQLRQTG